MNFISCLLPSFVLFPLPLIDTVPLPVDLPAGTPSKDPPPPDAVTIQVSAEGSLFWNRDPMDMSELPGRLTAYKSTTENPRVTIAGDEKARFGATVKVLDEIRKAGIDKFTVETRTRPT